MEHQRCTHAALLLAYLGWLPAIADAPSPTAPAPGVRCGVVGTAKQFSATRGWQVIDRVPCPECTPIAA